MSLATRLTDLVFPPLCPVTGEETGGHGALAPAAWRELGRIAGPARCDTCGRELPGAPPGLSGPALLCDWCVASPRPWDRGAAALRYEGSGRALVLALKRGDRLDLVPLLARWMREARPELVAEADLVIPVPLHRWRLLARRFNQSAELARALCRQAGKPGAHAPRLLRRVRPTPTQSGGRAEREANLAGAFALGPGAAERIAGRRVLLLDDVMTTGATLAACARAVAPARPAGLDVIVTALVEPRGAPYLTPDRDTEGDPT